MHVCVWSEQGPACTVSVRKLFCGGGAAKASAWLVQGASTCSAAYCCCCLSVAGGDQGNSRLHTDRRALHQHGGTERFCRPVTAFTRGSGLSERSKNLSAPARSACCWKLQAAGAPQGPSAPRGIQGAGKRVRIGGPQRRAKANTCTAVRRGGRVRGPHASRHL